MVISQSYSCTRDDKTRWAAAGRAGATRSGAGSLPHCGTCVKANFVYYRWDGSTSFCGERHTIDCETPVSAVRHAVTQMKQGVVPSECRLCQYLPPTLFRLTLEENRRELL